MSHCKIIPGVVYPNIYQNTQDNGEKKSQTKHSSQNNTETSQSVDKSIYLEDMDFTSEESQKNKLSNSVNSNKSEKTTEEQYGEIHKSDPIPIPNQNPRKSSLGWMGQSGSFPPINLFKPKSVSSKEYYEFNTINTYVRRRIAHPPVTFPETSDLILFNAKNLLKKDIDSRSTMFSYDLTQDFNEEFKNNLSDDIERILNVSSIPMHCDEKDLFDLRREVKLEDYLLQINELRLQCNEFSPKKIFGRKKNSSKQWEKFEKLGRELFDDFEKKTYDDLVMRMYPDTKLDLKCLQEKISLYEKTRKNSVLISHSIFTNNGVKSCFFAPIDELKKTHGRICDFVFLGWLRDMRQVVLGQLKQDENNLLVVRDQGLNMELTPQPKGQESVSDN